MTLEVPTIDFPPNGPQVLDLIRTDTAFTDNGLLTQISDITTIDGLDEFNNPIFRTPGMTPILLDELNTPITDSFLISQGFNGPPLSNFSTHVSNQLSSMPTNLTITTSAINTAQTALGSLTTVPSFFNVADPCESVNNFFNSILGDGPNSGAGLIQQLLAAILAGSIAAIIGLINDLIGDELKALIEALAFLAQFAGATSLFNNAIHPCGQNVLNILGTSNLLGQLGL